MARPTTMWLKAKPGLRVPYPGNSYRYLEGGDFVEVDVRSHEQLTYWTRRIDHGEVDMAHDRDRVTVPPARAAELGAPDVMIELPHTGEKKEG